MAVFRRRKPSYEDRANLFDLAAAYAFHIAKNSAFTDGNKRSGLQASLAFLRLDGYSIETSEESLFAAMYNLTSGELSEEAFSDYLRNCSVRIGGLTAFVRGVLGR